MGTTEDFGGLSGAVGGGGGEGHVGRNHFFPEFDSIAGLQITTKASVNSIDRVSETLTADLDFNDGAWRPASSVLNGGIPKIGDEHPSIEGCYLVDVSAQHRNNQGDLIRVTLDYKFPSVDKDPSGEGGGGGGSAPTPLDTKFYISFSPVIIEKPLSEDLIGKKICNINGEPYDLTFPTVRLDGICKWNQRFWDQSQVTDWVGVVNAKTWSEGDYKFPARTVICNYVIGNLAFFINDDGKQEPYYQMQAAISYYPRGIVDKEFKTAIRSQGSFFYENVDAKEPTDRRPSNRSGKFQFDINKDTGLLQTGLRGKPTSDTPTYDKFNVYTPVVFNFVDRQ